jgi:hypothetical protein
MRATFDRPGGRGAFGIRTVRPTEAQKLIAKQEIRHARKRLPGLPKLAVRWFIHEDPTSTVGGLVSPHHVRTIWLWADGPAIRNSITHECFHAWLRSIGVLASPDEEPAAYRFADYHDDEPVALFLNRKGAEPDTRRPYEHLL